MKLNLAKNQDNVSNLKDIIGHKIFGRFNTHQCDNVPSGEHSVAKGWVGAPNVPKILAMPGFWEHLEPQPIHNAPNEHSGCFCNF